MAWATSWLRCDSREAEQKWEQSVSFHTAVLSSCPKASRLGLLLTETFVLCVSEWIANYAASVVDQEELKAEVDTYMQQYDKKIAEVRPGWGGNPAKQSVWGEEGKRDLLVPWPQWNGQRETDWVVGLFYSQLLVVSQVLVWSTTP